MNDTETLKASETPFERYDTISRWPLCRIGSRFLIQISAPFLSPRAQLIPVIDVTDVADRLQLNQGQIENGEVVFGPGEAYATVGSEGSFAHVYLKDGRITGLVTHVSVTMTVS